MQPKIIYQNIDNGTYSVAFSSIFQTTVPDGVSCKYNHIVRELRQIAWHRTKPPGVSLCVAVDS